MHAHIVLAHPETQSFNGRLVDVAKIALQDESWEVTVSDLYGMGFDPCEKQDFYANPKDSSRFNVQAEQRHASDQGNIPVNIKEEIDYLDSADLLILQYPMWWHLPPAILKGWYDRVFLYGEIYTSSKRFESGRFSNKRAMLSITVGTSAETYAHNGRSGDIDLMLWPINFTLAYVGYKVLEPFIAYGVEAGISYSNPEVIEQRLNSIEQELTDRCRALDSIPEVPFNLKEDWGSDGRIKPTAPVYSPFIRHSEKLKLD
jgi:NAD(P)H dehydrogenase (quinone)